MDGKLGLVFKMRTSSHRTLKMRSLRLPWRRQPDISHTEPVLGKGYAWRTSDVVESDLPNDETGEHLHVTNDVLDQLGIGAWTAPRRICTRRPARPLPPLTAQTPWWTHCTRNIGVR